MPSIKVNNQATSTNALDGLKFQELEGPALISLYASAVTNDDTVSLSVGAGNEMLVDANPNLEAADQVQVERDQILFREPAPAGKLFMPVTATTAINFLLVIEEV